MPAMVLLIESLENVLYFATMGVAHLPDLPAKLWSLEGHSIHTAHSECMEQNVTDHELCADGCCCSCLNMLKSIGPWLKLAYCCLVFTILHLRMNAYLPPKACPSSSDIYWRLDKLHWLLMRRTCALLSLHQTGVS